MEIISKLDILNDIIATDEASFKTPFLIFSL
jgi:hypothetical protein